MEISKTIRKFWISWNQTEKGRIEKVDEEHSKVNSGKIRDRESKQSIFPGKKAYDFRCSEEKKLSIFPLLSKSRENSSFAFPSSTFVQPFLRHLTLRSHNQVEKLERSLSMYEVLRTGVAVPLPQKLWNFFDCFLSQD